MRKFSKKLYRDPASDRTPENDLADLLDEGVDVITLATYVKKIPYDGYTIGVCKQKVTSPQLGELRLWVCSENGYHLAYVHCAALQEVCFLYVYDGDIGTGLKEAVARLKMFYQMP